jgi:hypothetical protein
MLTLQILDDKVRFIYLYDLTVKAGYRRVIDYYLTGLITTYFKLALYLEPSVVKIYVASIKQNTYLTNLILPRKEFLIIDSDISTLGWI